MRGTVLGRNLRALSAVVAPIATVDTDRTHPFAKNAKGWGTRLVVSFNFFLSSTSVPQEQRNRLRGTVRGEPGGPLSPLVAPTATVG